MERENSVIFRARFATARSTIYTRCGTRHIGASIYLWMYLWLNINTKIK